MGMATTIPGGGDTSNSYLFELPRAPAPCPDTPVTVTIRRHHRRLQYIHVMTRKGFACWMIDIPIPPRSLGTRAQCSVHSRRSCRELQIKSWI